MSKKIVVVFLAFFIISLISANTFLFAQQEIGYEEFINLLNEGKVKQVSITDDSIKGVYLKDGRKILFSTVYPHDISLYELLNDIREKEVAIVPLRSIYAVSEEGFMRSLIFFLPSLLIFMILIAILVLNVLIYKILTTKK